MRRALAVGILALVAVAGAALTIGGLMFARADTSTVGDLRFENALRIPPLLEPRLEGGRKVFDLRLQVGRTELIPGRPTETWGASQSHLGPTLRARRGDEVRVEVANGLPEASTLHWHGMHLPASADGGPHQPIAPGATWSPGWRIDQPAATLWYHPHPHGDTEDHVYRGIAGLFIVDDEESASLPLPGDYGVDDIPVIVQDKRLHDDGSLDFGDGLIAPTGRLGSTVLVNGTHDPHLDVETERVRLRLLNASTARVYDLGFADGREFAVIAGDGGLLERPVGRTRVLLSPAERVEVVVTLEPGERAVLRSSPPDLGANFFEERFAGGDDAFDLLELRAAPALRPSPEVPARLAADDPPTEADAVRTRSFRLQGQGRINGREMDMDRIDEVVPAGDTELWEVENGTGTPHNFHVHGTSFRVLEVGGRPAPEELRGPKDTVYVPPGKDVRFLVRFEHADPETPLMYHCHLLRHEDRGMMGQLLVVDEGHETGTPRHVASAHADERPRSSSWAPWGPAL